MYVEKRKSKTKMSNSMFVSILILVCLNISTISCDLVSVNESTTNPSIVEPHQNESNINILFLSIENDLPYNTSQLTMVCDFDKGKNPRILLPRRAFSFVTNFELKICVLTWSPHRLSFHLYDRDQEGGLAHQRIFWSVRKDGLYHSWDEVSFDKRANWDN